MHLLKPKTSASFRNLDQLRKAYPRIPGMGEGYVTVCFEIYGFIPAETIYETFFVDLAVKTGELILHGEAYVQHLKDLLRKNLENAFGRPADECVIEDCYRSLGKILALSDALCMPMLGPLMVPRVARRRNFRMKGLTYKEWFNSDRTQSRLRLPEEHPDALQIVPKSDDVNHA